MREKSKIEELEKCDSKKDDAIQKSQFVPKNSSKNSNRSKSVTDMRSSVRAEESKIGDEGEPSHVNIFEGIMNKNPLILKKGRS